MQIKPKLNLSQHPKYIDNGSLVNAIDVMVSSDGTTLQSDLDYTTSNVQTLLEEDLGESNPTIISCIPCNKELILFVKHTSSSTAAWIYRYNEDYDKIMYCTTIEYSGGTIIGTFTYNYNNLIIAFSEYDEDDNLNIPLRTINLGAAYIDSTGAMNTELSQYDLIQLSNTNLHPICPVIKIPTVTCTVTKGSAYKGWYYVFIRYKISTNTYTQWFNTNEKIFVDDYILDYFFDYYISSEVNRYAIEGGSEKWFTHNKISNVVSQDRDVSNNTFECKITNFDDDAVYEYFQLGFICVSKSYTKCYNTDDIALTSSSITYLFNSSTVSEYSSEDMIITYNNYYSPKTIATINNRLYIANYKESNIKDTIISEISQITVTITSSLVAVTFVPSYSTVMLVSSDSNLNNVGLFPNQPYNFFIHFVDKYGSVTEGFNLSYFSNVTIDSTLSKKVNNIDDLLIISPSASPYENYITLNFTISNIPTGYIGWFVSYEKLEKKVKYEGVAYTNGDGSTYYNFYSDELNFKDTIKFDFDSMNILDYNNASGSTTPSTMSSYYYHYPNSSTVYNYNISNPKLYVADAYNNINLSTSLYMSSEFATKYNTIVQLIKSNNAEFYLSTNKTLIPCSSISYNTTDSLKINTKDAFITKKHAIRFRYFSASSLNVEDDDYYTSFYNSSVFYYQVEGYSTIYGFPLDNPFYCHVWYGYDDVPWESLQYNNKPVTTYFPYSGISTTDEYNKSFKVGFIVECKNTVDLYQQKQYAVGDAYPKSLTNYNFDNLHVTDFPKTIRRSNVIQDESKEISWRQFETEQYKNIIENKGNIIKLVPIGYYFLVHTQHSLFLFNATDTIKSDTNGIQLSSIDIWDIDYKEVLTSDLGCGGLQNQQSSIIGDFGYIFFDAEHHRLYRYDNDKLLYIDEDIISFIKNAKCYNAIFVDDKTRDRLLIKFNYKYKYNSTQSIIGTKTYSYNYKINNFISEHSNTFVKGYNTKENIYLITNNSTAIKTFSDYIYLSPEIYIMINTDYEKMKFIESVIYNIKGYDELRYEIPNNLITNTRYFTPIIIEVFNDNCDTGYIDISYTDASNEVNNVDDYTKAHWNLGNWIWNGVRNELEYYLSEGSSGDECSRIYGNYFIIYFYCANNSNCIKFEFIDAKFSNADNI